MNPTRNNRKDALLVFLLALGAYLITAGGHLYSPDEEVLFRVVRSLWERHELDIEPFAGGFASARNAAGKEYAQYGVGQPILATPFYAVGKALAPLGSDAAWRRAYGVEEDEKAESRGFPLVAAEIAPRLACSFFNIFLSAAMASALWLALMEISGHRGGAWLTASLYAFGSMAWPHSRPFFTEAGSAFFILLAWLLALRGLRGRMDIWFSLSGLCAGYAALVRMDAVLLYPGLAMLMLGPTWEAAGRLRPRVHPWICFCVPAALCGAALLGLNALHFGGPFKSGYSDQPEGVNFSTPVLAGLYGFLFSAGKGLFFFSPALALSTRGWVGLARRNRWIAAGAALSILVPLLMQSKWQNWAGGWCWGPRHIFAIHPFLAIPIVAWLADDWGPLRRGAALALLAVGAGVQLLGCSQDFIQFHRVFYRDPRRAFHVLYDDFDQQYWSRNYSLRFRVRPETELEEAPFAFMPAPVQHSLYLPQSSVWTGYPIMWKDYKMRDNLWLRLIDG